MTNFQDVLDGRAPESDDGCPSQVRTDNGKKPASWALTISLGNTLVLGLAGSRNGRTIAKSLCGM
jgi:hypothetical protein